ncbi:MAG TPA: isoprenylcysteine carboxylmethyltransferase family protein [Dongiaceae bacterium]|nr:isoprenylcysteine carboxylmethyltransferase family protein [Dongiaceae bacterium]
MPSPDTTSLAASAVQPRDLSVSSADDPPASVNRLWVTALGLAGMIIAVILLPRGTRPEVAILFILALTALPMLAVDIAVFKVHRRSTTGLDWTRAPDFSLERSATKLVGLLAVYIAIGFVYWVLQEYRSDYYKVYFNFVRLIWPYVAIVTLAYVPLVDAYMVQPRDGYWQAGRALLGGFRDADRKVLAQYVLGWAVKGFFLPYILPNIMGDIYFISDSPFSKGASGFSPFYDFAYNFLYTIDVVFASLGYLMTLRVSDSHIRSTDPTTLGWLVTLICYRPFGDLLYDLLPYEASTPYFGTWLRADHPVLYWIFGSTTLVCLTIYAASSMLFGYRFSNLTHRGILTNGPYRLTKHPQYLFKNISWWLIAVPFASAGGTEAAVRACLMLAAYNFIYFMRARTEERHLSRDPTYVAYALWINEHGILAWLGRLIPFLRYKPPVQATNELQGRRLA